MSEYRAAGQPKIQHLVTIYQFSIYQMFYNMYNTTMLHWLAGNQSYVMSSILLVKHQTDVSHQFIQF